MEAEAIDVVTQMVWKSVLTLLLGMIIIAAILWRMIDKKFNNIDSEFKDGRNDLKDVRSNLKNLSDRVSRIEGTLYHLYNPNIRTGTHE